MVDLPENGLKPDDFHVQDIRRRVELKLLDNMTHRFPLELLIGNRKSLESRVRVQPYRTRGTRQTLYYEAKLASEVLNQCN